MKSTTRKKVAEAKGRAGTERPAPFSTDELGKRDLHRLIPEEGGESEPKPAKPDAWNRADLKHLSRPVAVGHDNAIHDEDLPYLSEFHLLEKRRHGLSRFLPWLALAFVGILLAWAAVSEIEEVTRCQGKVIPSRSVQIIQSLEGGIVESIKVEEGEMVERGQPLLRLQDAIYSSRYEENLRRAETLKAKMIRLKAVKGGFLAALEFPEDTPESVIETETELYEKAKTHYAVSQSSLNHRLGLAREQEGILKDSGRAVPKLELIKIRRDIAELEGEMQTLQTSTKLGAMDELDRARGELEVILETIKGDKDRLDRTLITSPVRGTVNKIYINTAGRVVGSGDDIMEIVPADDTLLIEADVRPSDIGFIAPSQDAKVKFTAYDYTVYGGLDGQVEQIGVDTIANEEGESFYQIKVRTRENSLGRDAKGKDLIIIPGMVAEVDILTGRKTVLSYLLRPISRARERALRER